jgi:hypothetical protein
MRREARIGARFELGFQCWELGDFAICLHQILGEIAPLLGAFEPFPGAYGQLGNGLTVLDAAECSNGNPAPPSNATPSSLCC